MPNNGDAKPAWEIVLQIAGAGASLGAVAYVVGASVVWLRLDIAGYPADAGLEVMPYARVAATGMRAIAVVALIAGLSLLLTRAYASRWRIPLRGFLVRRLWLAGPVIAVLIAALGVASFRISARGFWTFIAVTSLGTAAVALAVERDGYNKSWWVAAMGGLIAILASSTQGWRLFGLVLGVLGVIAFGLSSVRKTRTGRRYGPWWVTTGIIISVVAGAIAWQIRSPISIDTVRISPAPHPDMEGVFVPFFGATDAFVYVGEVRLNRNPNSQDKYTYVRAILEVPRDEISTVAFGEKGRLGPAIRTPAGSLFAWLGEIWADISN